MSDSEPLPDSTDQAAELRDHVRKAALHASVFHPDDFTVAAPLLTTLATLSLHPGVALQNRIGVARELLEQLPDCRSKCPGRRDGEAGWT